MGGFARERAERVSGTDGLKPPAWWALLLDLVLPAQCAGCGVTGPAEVSKGLCAACTEALSGPPRRARPSRPPAGLPPAHALAAYREPVPDIVIAQKEHGRLDLARPLGRQLARAVLAGYAAAGYSVRDGLNTFPGGPSASHGADGGPQRVRADGDATAAGRRSASRAAHDVAGRSALWLIPAPSSRRAVRRRGDDPVRRMTGHAAAELRRCGLHADALAALRHTRGVADQAGLSTAERARNLAGALTVRRSAARLLPQRPTVLVDDVLTSGSTLAEAARAVRSAGGEPVAVAVIAATRLG